MTVDDYTPSEAAVEVVARAIHAAEFPIGSDERWERCAERVRVHYRKCASAALVAFMGETVTEPCANPKCENGRIYWAAEVGPSRSTGFDPCPDCPSPRSLAVVECEAAGLLVPIMIQNDDGAGGMLTDENGMTRSYSRPPTIRTIGFREAAPSTGSPT